MTSGYFVKLDRFEGPLDLLLHLIKVHELDIFAIDLYVLTSQYLDYLRLIQFKDLRDASAFMEMAASLVEIKSRYLLPNEELGLSEDGFEDEDPEASLQRRLLEYETFRNASEWFSDKMHLGYKSATNHESERLEPMYESCEFPLIGDGTTLVVLYEQMLAQLTERKPARVTAMTHKISVEDVINKMKSAVEKLRFMYFQGMYRRFPGRYHLVANILAMLQLVRDGEMNIHQETMMGPIWLYGKSLGLQDLPEEVQQGQEGEDLPEQVAIANSTDGAFPVEEVVKND